VGGEVPDKKSGHLIICEGECASGRLSEELRKQVSGEINNNGVKINIFRSLAWFGTRLSCRKLKNNVILKCRERNK
jgi:hypothetical protein